MIPARWTEAQASPVVAYLIIYNLNEDYYVMESDEPDNSSGLKLRND